MGTLTFHHLSCSFDTFFFMVCGGFWAATKVHLILLMQSKRCKCVKYGRDWGAGGDEGLIWDGKLRVILCAVGRGQSSYSHSPPVLTSHLCCSLAKYKMGLEVKSCILLIHSHRLPAVITWCLQCSELIIQERYAFSFSASKHILLCDVLMTFLTRRSFCLLALSPHCDHHNA